ncbi:MAG: alpha/beta hydrolase, partial [Chitinophagales bacterium]
MLQLPLQYGPYNVGYKYHCLFDEGRFYQTSHPNPQTTLRPIPLNTWYPAQKTETKSRMVYEDYWDFQSKDSCLAVFHQRLKNYNIEKAHLYFTGKGAANRTEADEQSFRRLRQSRVMSSRNAPEIEEAFPMIVYHQGLDAHIDDNVLLLEYLASWGYVVVSSSYHSMDATTMNIDWDVKRSVADVEVVLQYQKRQFNVKSNQIVLMGHSFGAQAMMSFVAEKYAQYGNKLKGLILLDSTIDYAFYKKNDRCLNVVSKLKSTQFQTPTLAFARLSATFKLLNQLPSTHRYYCKVGHVLHNDFISIGATAAAFRSEKSQDDFAIIWRNYQQICVFVHHFLEA